MRYSFYCALCFLITGCSTQYSCDIDVAFSNVTPMVEEANAAFDKAEKELLNIKPDDIVRPDPDISKCPCKGSGVITHGDGHQTQCPYHSKTMNILKR
jgi:hypothetical protein